MTYKLIQPPIYKPFVERTNAEAKEYFNWFIKMIPERIFEVEREITSSTEPDYRQWVPDKTEESLNILTKWLETQVNLRVRSDTELASIRSRMTEKQKLAGVSEKVLDEKSYSLVIDVGMYFGEMLLKRCSWLRWELMMKPKRHIHVYQPVITPFPQGYSCSPLAISLPVISRLAWQINEPDELLTRYQQWVQLALTIKV